MSQLTTLQGEVFYLPKIALPAGCTLTVRLEDVSLADAAADLIAISTTEITQQVPLPFELSYDPCKLGNHHADYALAARIEHEGRLLWINDTRHPVQLTGENQTGLSIQVVAVNR